MAPSPGVNVAVATFVVATSVVAIHVIDVLLRETPAAVALAVGLCGLVLANLVFVYSGELPRGLLALFIGIAAAIEAFGIAVAHTIKSAAAGSDTTGVAAAVAAVVLAVLGAVLIVRRVRTWRRWLALPIAFGLVVYVVAPLSMALNVTHSNPGAGTGSWTSTPAATA